MIADPTFRHVIVIGASADGVVALKHIAHALPSDFPAPLLVVLHVGPHSQLPLVLSRVAHMPALHPFDGEALYPGRIYVARPEQQLRVARGSVRFGSEREDHHRPSIDALFRSASEAYGSHVIGVVLTGADGDGAEGLRAIKAAGGIAIVQDPAEAGYPNMPLAAFANTEVDYVRQLVDIGPLLCRLVRS